MYVLVISCRVKERERGGRGEGEGRERGGRGEGEGRERGGRGEGEGIEGIRFGCRGECCFVYKDSCRVFLATSNKNK